MAFVAGLEATRRCNFRCAHCYVDAGGADATELSHAEIEDVIRSLADAGARGIAWSGGEALLRRDLTALTAFANSLGLPSTLATNGYLANRERLQALADAGLTVVQVSLDGPDASRASRFRQGPHDAFARAVAAAEAGVAAGLHTYICSIFAPETAPDLDAMIALARSLGADGLRYTMWTPTGRARGQTYDERAWASLAVRRFLERVARAQEQPDQEGVAVLIDCPTGALPGPGDFRCRAGHEVIYITSRGDLYPCTSLMLPAYCVGNVREQPLAALLASPAMRRIHRQRARLHPSGPCAGCDLAESCRGGCPSGTLLAYGKVSGGPHRGAAPICLRHLHGK